MDKTTALHHLPELYARALLLHEEGLDHHSIAERLGIPVEAVEPCLLVGELKLESVLIPQPEQDAITAGDGFTDITDRGGK
ncbi:MAG: sigma-70 region 4 domain-containing protein [Actinomycetota bacterium]